MLWFNLRSIFSRPYGFNGYIWIDCILIKEPKKAILIMFDNRKIWLPKAWIVKIKRDKNSCSTGIKISQYNWARKAC